MKIRYLIALLMIVVADLVYATETALPPPPLPEKEEITESSVPLPGELPEPEVTIVNRAEERVEEYRRGGILYMVKVVPQVGPSYYLIDTDGDGNLETRRDGLEPNISIPMWMLFQW
ncbi:conserved hypothetical protein [Gammaproteobacteria bacterium]